jgi:hypothetical protein
LFCPLGKETHQLLVDMKIVNNGRVGLNFLLDIFAELILRLVLFKGGIN